MAHFYTQLEHPLRETDPTRKCAQTLELYQQYHAGSLKIVNDSPVRDIQIAGRPARPELVPATAVDKRKTSTTEGYAAMLHAIAHIEFNAINLALDAAYRFRTLPAPFAANWLQVAKEECEHFALMRARLNAHGYDYGDFTAHAHLWDMAYKTAYDPLLDPQELFRRLLRRYDMFIFRGHVNLEAREQAGFSAFELAMLEHFEASLKV